jgi:5-methylcytosine-specific restriction endonuclease McrA
MFTPIIDFTNQQSSSFMEQLNDISSIPENSEKKILSSGKNTTKRSVSETKKKYVASLQNWKCAKCQKQLNAWFEVDHKVRLEYGGGNDVQNLEALCRECHGKKTAMENM